MVSSSPLLHRAAIALGSNLSSSAGDPEDTLMAAIDAIESLPGTVLEASSSVYRTAPVGPPQPDYFNACVVISTMTNAPQLMQTLLKIERQFERVRSQRWGPRTLDLDLLLFDDVVLDDPLVQIPHPRMADRAFVLMPLTEIVPEWTHPVLGQTIQTLAQQVSAEGVQRIEMI